MGVFTGTGRLIALILRRDRIKLPVWILITVGLMVMFVGALKESYPTPEDWAAYYQLLQTSAVGRLFAGVPIEPTFGGLATAETAVYIGLMVAFMNTLLVVRHTRQNEELGSTELLQSARIGRYAPLTAVLLIALVANGIVAVGLSGALLTEEMIPSSGAWLFGISQGLVGMSFAAIAGVAAQLAGASRSANSLAAIAIGVTFMLRGVGDMFARTVDGRMETLWLSWLSPFGWLQAAKPLTTEMWWPLWVFAGFIVLSTALSYVLLSQRDVGSGILPARRGAKRASRFMLAPLGLTARLQRGVFIGWLVTTIVMSVTMGAMANELEKMAMTSDAIRIYLESSGGTGNFVKVFMSTMIAMTALLVVAYALQALQRLRSEEVHGYVESLFGAAVSRASWVLSQVAVVGIGAVIMLLATGVSIAATAGVVTGTAVGDWQIGEYVFAALSYLPALLVFVGLVVLSVGAVPKLAIGLAWTFFAFTFFVGQLGALLKLPDWLVDISPFAHVAAAPSEDIATQPLMIFIAIATGLVVFGLLALRRRDISA